MALVWPPAADDNFIVHATWATRGLPGARVVLTDDLVLVDSGLNCDTFNVVCAAHLSRELAQARIGDALSFFRATGHAYSWWLTPGYSPADLPSHLELAGLIPAESELAMAANLTTVSAPTTARGVEIRRVATAADLEAFATVLASNWSPPDSFVIRYYTAAAEAFLRRDAPQHLFIGFVDGHPVSTGEMTLGAGIAGLYGISTSVEARGRGCATAMVAALMADASAAGCQTAILQAAPEAVRVYERAGFERVGTIVEFKPTT